MTYQRLTCPQCNAPIVDRKCTNRDGCLYRGTGWTDQQRREAWSQVGSWERTTGAQYDYTGRD